MVYRVRAKGDQWVILDSNDDIAGVFRNKDQANNFVKHMNNRVKTAKKVKKTKKSKKTEKK
tara:strand:+ start:528 stop:710 length:183 start_codon:yes stop_codon:yes gene_type:complete